MKLFKTNFNYVIPQRLPVIPTIDVVAFPHMIIPLLIVDEKIIQGIQQAIESGNKLITIVACKKKLNQKTLSIGPQDLHSVGTIAQIIKVIPDHQEGTTKVLVQGIIKTKLLNIKVSDVLTTEVVPIENELFDETNKNHEEKIDKIRNLICTLSKINNITADPSFFLSKIHDFDKLVEFVISYLSLNFEDLQKILELNSYEKFFDLAIQYLVKEIEMAEIQNRAKMKAKESINNSQKEFFLREQIKALREELDDQNDEIDVYRQKLYELEDSFHEESFKEILQSINRLENMSAESAEAGILKNYLDFVFDLPWEQETKDNNNITKAKKILDDQHYGLDEIKERVLDFLSVKQLSKNPLSTIMCLYGPPGVGKTSLAESIAHAMGRKSFRISVGGMKDEAEIRGHRRTYVGAMPGRIMKGMKQTQSNNPVIIIDEIDKISSEFRGDPAAALLEVFDYKQNNAFYDYYLGIPFDLSKVFFIATANNIENIPLALKDRMDMIELNSYSFDEKLNISKNYLLKKITKESGLQQKQNLTISDETLIKIITEYTYEAGIRDLERVIKKLFYKIARKFIETNKIPKITNELVEEYLGAPKYVASAHTTQKKIGVSNGLCYTPCGGEVLYIETIILKGTGKFILTGQLGDVMKESAQIAYNLIRLKSVTFSILENIFSEYDIHVHVPAGAIPKDGPSAGVALFVSILSGIKKSFVDGNFAMTGEIDLQGNILPVGGIKEKLLAAKKQKIKNVFLPEKNKYDVSDIEELVSDIEIRYVQKIEEIISILFPQIVTTEEVKISELQRETPLEPILEHQPVDEILEVPIFSCKMNSKSN
jgi:ATP-dependent Lon protease